MFALCEANEERPGSRDHASDSHVLHRRPLDWPTHMCTHRYTDFNIVTDTHTAVQEEARYVLHYLLSFSISRKNMFPFQSPFNTGSHNCLAVIRGQKSTT